MDEMKKFSEKLQERLSRGQDERHTRKLQTNIEMVRLLDKQRSFHGIAHDFLVSAVYPRLQELSRQFDNSRVGDISQTDELRCTCKFSHSKRFPATASIEFVVSPGEGYGSLNIDYNITIFPMLMDYDSNDKRSFPLDAPSWDELNDWVESKILEFVDTYLKLETHPMYQKENRVLDPVCGMIIPIPDAAAQVEFDGRITYFCSETCKSNFLGKRKAG
jgi:YHS domain-containing protein